MQRPKRTSVERRLDKSKGKIFLLFLLILSRNDGVHRSSIQLSWHLIQQKQSLDLSDRKGQLKIRQGNQYRHLHLQSLIYNPHLSLFGS